MVKRSSNDITILKRIATASLKFRSPASDMMWYMNKFKYDFRGQIVSIERVQSSLDHVPHREPYSMRVAVLFTLAILRDLATSSLAKEHENVPVKYITFSQPPVGNAALKDYVHQKGWQGYFKTYCIPEDLVPRILSLAYFHRYNTQVQQPSFHEGSTYEEETSRSSFQKDKTNDGEESVLGVGPVQTSIWRLTNLALEAVCKHLNVSSLENYSSHSAFTTAVSEPQSLEIHEDSDGIFLTSLDPDGTVAIESHVIGKNSSKIRESRRWHRVPLLPSYVPFGRLLILNALPWERHLQVRSVITELRERFQSHSMKSYRSHFQNLDPDYEIGSLFEARNTCSDGLNNFVLYCTSDFFTISKEGAGKTSLFIALLDYSQRNRAKLDLIYSDMVEHKLVEGGVCYLNSVAVSLQEPKKNSSSVSLTLRAMAVSTCSQAMDYYQSLSSLDDNLDMEANHKAKRIPLTC
ncbi:hypothetical protein ZIOFF_064517 [Zingiber officinale]|uniref:Fungal lipase-type domain-containing protein n=1 Tax=Zingiber officinale TaxID=94328 RepID=A0A8J5EW15_ZINOF|nr:hypothetical protein ZIOFF_064517 [Zingiber officinale]